MEHDQRPSSAESFENDDVNKNDPQFAFDSLESVRKKLLDLTGRNQLLNYKHPKASCVRIIDELPDQIYAEHQSGKTFTFIPIPEPTEQQLIDQGYLRWDKNDQLVELKPFPNAERWASYLGFNTNYELPELNNEPDDKHQDLDIQTLMYATELETRLRTIRGKAETAIEESGSNILYIVGFSGMVRIPRI